MNTQNFATQFPHGVFVEPVQSLSSVAVHETSQMLAKRISDHGLKFMVDQGYVYYNHDEKNNTISLSETMPNLAKSLFEPTSTVLKKIESQGYENMVKKGYLVQI